MLMLETIFRLQIAEHGAASAQHIHGMGIGGNAFQHFQQRLGQGAQAAQLALVGVKLLLTGQLPLEQQIGDLLELGAVGQLLDVIAAIGKTGATLAYCADTGLPCALTAQTGSAQRFLLSHKLPPIPWL